MKRLKKKSTLGLLIGIVLLIWGIVFFQIVQMTVPTPSKETVGLSEMSVKTATPPALLLNYRDPFRESAGTSSGRKAEVSLPLPQQTEVAEPPPTFRWLGKISKGVKDFLLLATERGTRLIELNEQVEGYTVRRIYSDSIVVVKKHQAFVLYK